LLTLLGDPALAQKYGQAARATIEKHYSFECIMDRYIEIYQIITGRGQIYRAPGVGRGRQSVSDRVALSPHPAGRDKSGPYAS